MPYGKIFTVAFLVFAFDRITKVWIVEWLDLKNIGRIDVWDPYLTLRMAWNHGVNFGIFNLGEDGWWVLVCTAVVIVGVVLFWTRKATGWLVPFATGLVVGGAAGNAFDRLTYGAVADFLNMSCCGIQNPFAFNVADVAIFVGAVLLIIYADSVSAPTKKA